MVSSLGFLVSCLACLFYGSYFVPARKYEIHDGLVFQWFQCSGILLCGVVCGLLRNSWSEEGRCSPGFYVCPEGVLSGLLFVAANALANVAVKACGIGVYYTLHEVSNLGVTFVIGVFGPAFGVPATPPRRVDLAALGIALVLVGATPIMFMEPEETSIGDREGQPVSPQAPDPADAAPALEDLFNLERQRAGSAASPGGLRLPDSPTGRAAVASPVRPRVESVHSGTASAELMWRGGMGKASAPGAARNFSVLNSQTWDGTIGRPRLNFEMYGNRFAPSFVAGLVHMEAVSESDGEQSPVGLGALGAALLDPPGGAPSSLGWWWGIFLSLSAGFLYSLMYVPTIFFKARAEAEGWTPSGFDSFFSLAVGIYCGSSAWLICASAWKKYQGQRLEKPVLRPALLTGMVYGFACIFYLFAMVLLPYVVAYTLGVGGGMMVSQAWGILVFGEAASAYNRRLVGLSFTCMSLGIVFLSLSA